MVDRACETSRHDLPAMEPESSIRRVVSKVARNEYGSSPPRVAAALAGRADVASAAASGIGNSEIWVRELGPTQLSVMGCTLAAARSKEL